LPLLAWAAKPKADWQDLLEKRTFTEGKNKLPYRLLKPDDYDPKKSYPLVVFLHGAGERGDNNTAQLVHGVAEFAKPANRKKYPCFLIAPQCPARGMWVKTGQIVLDLIAAIQKEFSIDKKRIYLTGLSMGGYGTWDLLARRPDLFAAGIPICGGGDEKNAKKLAKIAIWAFHGDKDVAVKVERSRNMIEAIKKAGGSPKYTEYKGVGHNSWTRTYSDPKVMEWLFEQKK
jgi:predicted peptidase